MYSEAKKLSLVEAVMQVSNEATLVELETVIRKMPAK
jgi:hypothetical protein